MMHNQQQGFYKAFNVVGAVVGLLAITTIAWAQGNGWSTKTEMPTARLRLSTSTVNGKIYAIGGLAGRALRQVEVYDPATDTWTTAAAMPTARTAPSLSVVENRIYAIGGSTTDHPWHACATVEAYDPSFDPGPTSIEALSWGTIKTQMRQ